MNVFVLYHPSSDHARSIEEFSRDFTQQTQKTVELIDVDGQDGSAKARLYDVVQYPAVLAVDNEGKLLKLWQGGLLPRIQEVSYYTEA